MDLTHYVNTCSATCHNKPRKIHGFGGTRDTGARTWDLLHQRPDPHQLSYTCNFPLVLFWFPPCLIVGVFFNKCFIKKGFLTIVTHVHELFVFICKAFPSIVRGILLW